MAPSDAIQPPIGILGGTFDPVHNGHLRLALETAELLGLAEVRLVPNGQPPHRETPGAPADRRARWVESAVEPEPRLKLDDREIRRAGRSYTVDTLADMRGQWPDTPLCLLMGRDVFANLPSWHQWRRLFELAHIVLIDRADEQTRLANEAAAELDARQTDDTAALAADRAGAIVAVTPPTLTISASRIRHLIAAGASPRYLLPEAVLADLARDPIYAAPEAPMEAQPR